MIDVQGEWLAKSAKLGDGWSSWIVVDAKGPFFYFWVFLFFCKLSVFDGCIQRRGIVELIFVME
jgi:hypothetical protein